MPSEILQTHVLDNFFFLDTFKVLYFIYFIVGTLFVLFSTFLSVLHIETMKNDIRDFLMCTILL